MADFPNLLSTAALRKIPGFETGTFAVPADVNSLTDQLSKTEALIETDITNLLQQASIIAKSVPAIQSPEITKILTAINGIADQVGAKVGTYENNEQGLSERQGIPHNRDAVEEVGPYIPS